MKKTSSKIVAVKNKAEQDKDSMNLVVIGVKRSPEGNDDCGSEPIKRQKVNDNISPVPSKNK